MHLPAPTRLRPMLVVTALALAGGPVVAAPLMRVFDGERVERIRIKPMSERRKVDLGATPDDAATRNRFERGDVTRRRERIERRLDEARDSSRDARLVHKLAWGLGRAFSELDRPRVTIEVSDQPAELASLAKLGDPVKIRKRVVAAMERQLDTALGELLPKVNPDLQERYAYFFSDAYARSFLGEQQRAVGDAIAVKQQRLTQLTADQAAVEGELDELQGRKDASAARVAELDGKIAGLRASPARSAEQFIAGVVQERAVELNVQSFVQAKEQRVGQRWRQLVLDQRALTQEIAQLEPVRDALAVVPVGGVLPINSEQAAQVYHFDKSPDVAALRRRYPDGVRYTEAGFPDFSPYAIAALQGEFSSSRDKDFANANAKLYADLTAGHLPFVKGPRQVLEAQLGKPAVKAIIKDLEQGKTPTGYTWHHHEAVDRISAVGARLQGLDFENAKVRRGKSGRGLRRVAHGLIDLGRPLTRGELLLVPSDLHGAARHHGGVSRAKYLVEPPQFREIEWNVERTSQPRPEPLRAAS